MIVTILIGGGLDLNHLRMLKVVGYADDDNYFINFVLQTIKRFSHENFLCLAYMTHAVLPDVGYVQQSRRSSVSIDHMF